jgi:hypothetical protein
MEREHTLQLQRSQPRRCAEIQAPLDIRRRDQVVYIAAPVGYFVPPRFAFSIALGLSLLAIALTILTPVLAIRTHAEIRA